ncbi:GGDEF domain-containing protein [Thermospira aquatica]|uniref:Diguanylate cyclase n=1 Tax=Thermospira aquatica TaxID=2828656 RepID=A0AAX3BFN6_9SPIR|nr:diguanylate cyclase [Thermospira aquatica]URA10953.1 diguanylate cyclase [Thermospira aquatica]
MSALKKLCFFLLFSLGIVTALIVLFPYERVYILGLFLAFVGMGTAYLYVVGATSAFVNFDFLFFSALGLAGVLVGTLYEIFFLTGAPAYDFLYPLHLVLFSWMSLWLFFSAFFVSRRLKYRWPVVLIWGVAMAGLFLVLQQYGGRVLPFLKGEVMPRIVQWVIGIEGLSLVTLGLVFFWRHRMALTLYASLVLWIVFRMIAGVFWLKASVDMANPLWFQYILTIEWLGLLFGLDGALYSGIHQPFHKLSRQIQILNEEKMLSLRLDRITRTLNADAFQDMVRYEVLRQKRQRSDLALLAIDALITMKDNSQYNCPDNVLGLLAASFRANLRAHDVISHWGGGRFTILLLDTDLVGACTVAKKIQEVVSMSEYLCGKDEAEVQLFMGAAVYMEGMGVEDFLSLAFRNLSLAREKKTNSVVTEGIFESPKAEEL